jgi:hypothetical protein
MSLFQSKIATLFVVTEGAVAGQTEVGSHLQSVHRHVQDAKQ